MKAHYPTFIFIAFFACAPKSFTDKDTYKRWVFSEESGYTQSSQTDNLKFQLVHIPNNLADLEFVEVVEDKDEEIKVFQFRIITTVSDFKILNLGLEDKDSYTQRIKKLEYEMGSMFKAIASDTVLPVFYHYENYRGLKNEILVHVHFLTEDVLDEDLQVLFNDKIFNTGSHLFVFDQSIVNDPPIIKNIS